MDYDVEMRRHIDDSYFQDASYLLTSEELRSIDRDVKQVIWANAVAQKAFPTINLPRGKRQYRYYKFEAISPPITSQDFLPESMENLVKTEYNIDLLGFSKDYFISMVDIDASRNSEYVNQSLDTSTVREMTAMTQDYWERFIWRGEDFAGPTRYYDDTSTTKTADPDSIIGDQTGIFNDSNIQTVTNWDGTDNTIASAGDITYGLAQAAKAILAYHFAPPFDVVMTPNVYGHAMMLQNSTTNISDLERILTMTDKDGGKLFGNIHVTPHLGKGTEEVLVFAPRDPAGNATARIVQSYPLWHYPITSTRLGVQGKVFVMGASAVIRPNAFCKNGTSLTLS